jgi:hypothetical protein
MSNGKEQYGSSNGDSPAAPAASVIVPAASDATVDDSDSK